MDIFDLPDRPLVVKCTFDKANKKISFNSARNCSFILLKEKVEKCFSLRSSIISWKDDDGETTHIVSDPDLAEAVQYFCSGDDPPLSSAASILSGRSFGSKRITLRVTITVDYDGPSLSDTSSLASIEDYQTRPSSYKYPSSLNGRSLDLEDDEITVSSRDHMTTESSGSMISYQSRQSRPPLVQSSPTVHYDPPQPSNSSDRPLPPLPRRPEGHVLSQDSYSEFAHEDLESARERYPADPSKAFADDAVFARLKLQEELEQGDGSEWESVGDENLGARWLREQKERAIRSRLGALPEPSISEHTTSSFDRISGDLSLERNNSGRYYYTYNASASGSQTHVSTDEDVYQAQEDRATSNRGKSPMKPRPQSRHLNWLVEQQHETEEHRRLRSSASNTSLNKLEPPPKDLSPYQNDDYSHYADLTSPPPETLTDCSVCGTLLDSIRYVCSICGEKPPIGARHQHNDQHAFSYPPPPLNKIPHSHSPTTPFFVGSAETLYSAHTNNSNPFGSSSALSSRTQLNPPTPGYELCAVCFQESGINHAIDAGLSSPSPSLQGPGSPRLIHSASSQSTWRRSAPKKGQIRHAFQEKFWGDFGWEDIAQDESVISKCTTCSAVTTRQRYKCAACPSFHLCRACYSLVHDIHPNDAFILVPDAPHPPSDHESSPIMSHDTGDSSGEPSLEHHGVSCAHCLLPIVGARFHCAICDSVDICSNCEAAGLPGNLDSANGGHNSSHILIKIPVPLESRELENASRRALRLWQGRDSVYAFTASKTSQNAETAYAQTVIGVPSAHAQEDHKIPCSYCNQSIRGARYQCAHCPSRPKGFNLCSTCDARSWSIHDPMHIFFKIPRPIDTRNLESPTPFLPPLYETPAGPQNPSRVDDPKAYLKDLVHAIAICDKCMTHIEGEWFRCANCSIDLCEHCESVDTHSDKHIFLVIKSTINLPAFKNFTNPENPTPIISSSVYRV